MKHFVLISLLLVVLSVDKGRGLPVEGDDAAAAPSDNATVAQNNSAKGRSLIVGQGNPDLDYFDCFKCTFFNGGENKLCDNPEDDLKLGMRSVHYVSECSTTRPRDVNKGNWKEVGRCVLITGKGWKDRRCLRAEEFLGTFYHDEWKRTKNTEINPDYRQCDNDYFHHDPNYLKCKEDAKRDQEQEPLLTYFKKHMDELDKCTTFGEENAAVELCGCKSDLCNGNIETIETGDSFRVRPFLGLVVILIPVSLSKFISL